MVVVYEAKKRSEKATGVGQQTDMYVITKDNVIHLSDVAIKELEGMYQKRIDEEKKVMSEMESLIVKSDTMKYVQKPPES